MNAVAVLLVIAAAWLGHRWLGERAQNAQLRLQVDSLKRRLAQRRDG